MKNAFWCLCIGLALLHHIIPPVDSALQGPVDWLVTLQVYLVHIGVFGWLYWFYRKTEYARLAAAGSGALAVEIGFIAETVIMGITSDGQLPPAFGIYQCFPFMFVFTVQSSISVLFQMLHTLRKKV